MCCSTQVNKLWKMAHSKKELITWMCNNITFVPPLSSEDKVHSWSPCILWADCTAVQQTCMEAFSSSSSLQLTYKRPSGMTSVFKTGLEKMLTFAWMQIFFLPWPLLAALSDSSQVSWGKHYEPHVAFIRLHSLLVRKFFQKRNDCSGPDLCEEALKIRRP